jgi:hypothetical protein
MFPYATHAALELKLGPTLAADAGSATRMNRIGVKATAQTAVIILTTVGSPIERGWSGTEH